MSRNNCSLCTVILAILSTAIIPSKGVVLDCYTTTVSKYDGHQQTSKDEQPCLRWDQFETYSASDFPDATKSDAANFCRSPDGHNESWCFTTDQGDRRPCGITKCGDDGLSYCGQLSIAKPTILGRYVTFSFTPDTYDPYAILEWQRSMNGIDQWKTLPLNNKFTQFEKQMILHMILSDSEKNQDERFYRVHYYNETSHCWMNAGKLTLQETGHCGLVYLRSEKLIKNGTVEIEYYPSSYVMENSGSFERSWVHTVDKKIETLILADGSFEETVGQNNKYVLTIYMLSVSMNGRYSVYCGERLLYTNDILIKLPEPPNTPVIVGLQDIEKCRFCIVAEDNEMFKLACEIHGGTPPLTITMTIGNESYIPLEWNSTTFIVHFTVRDNHHMENVIISVMNDALLSPLNVTAQMFVIKPPTFQVSVPEILRDGEAVNITCTIDDGRPNPNVYLSISGSAVSSVDSHFYNSTTSLHTNIITLTTFKKEWNKENITCCRYNEWYKIVRDCPPPKQVNYQFPPTYVMLEVKVDEHRLSRMYATCTVYDSNPACSVQFSAPSGIIGSEKSSENVRLPHGAWNSVYEVNLNVSEEDNGKDVTCIVECDEFPVDLTDTVKILLPFPPVIRFNISGSTLNISEGDRAHVKCEAESVPASNISWTEELSNEHIRKKQCDLSPNCVLNINTDEVSNRRFMCHVHYKTKVDHKYLTVQIIANPDGREAGDYMSKTGTNETCVSLGAVVGSVIGVLAVGILIGVICTLCILTRKGIIAGSKTQPTVSRVIELTGPPTALDTYEQLQNRTDTETRETYDSLEVNSRVQQNSQSQYESLNQDAEQYHTYTDLKQSR